MQDVGEGRGGGSKQVTRTMMHRKISNILAANNNENLIQKDLLWILFLFFRSEINEFCFVFVFLLAWIMPWTKTIAPKAILPKDTIIKSVIWNFHSCWRLQCYFCFHSHECRIHWSLAVLFHTERFVFALFHVINCVPTFGKVVILLGVSSGLDSRWPQRSVNDGAYFSVGVWRCFVSLSVFMRTSYTD